ncbi:hypothetical protein rosmuc_00473 [Roseovarius mucosus DSM 17069]|uniref:Lipoprotein n=1 Tax=Roseovarius mucosus DSM 17069 TaxID=1288298 RepID=A0A0A0HRK4_9RHOB|nr:hypothetical protein [Roseovarius mucosus]KGM89875.1 hypothetical protein rosmuc_00473 [Roseovarius mucosus DSM 17069]
MVGSNKILTVSYGTFSCTLEGFDDSFDTMKAIAEYFRDLAADDRYFGAEPPTPDAEMLARIAEREIARRVEAHEERGKIVLRAANEQAAMHTPLVAPAPAPQTTPEPERPDTAPEMTQTAPAPQVVAEAAPEMVETDETAQELANLPEETVAEVPEAIASEAPDQPEGLEQEPRIAPAALAPDSESIAAKLSRIRSVVAQETETADAEYSEDEHAQDFLDTVAEDLSAVLAEDDRAESAEIDEVEEDVDFDAILSAAPIATPAPQEVLAEQEPEAEETGADDFEDTLAALMADATPTDTETSHAPETTPETLPLARVIKVKRAEFEAAVAEGIFEEDDEDDEDFDGADDNLFDTENTILSPEEEAELQRELAEVEAELALEDAMASEPEPEAEIAVQAAEDDEQPTATEETAAEDEPTPPVAAEQDDAEDEDEFAVTPVQDQSTRRFDEAAASNDLTRIFDKTDTQLDAPASSQRRNAIQHLRAAVAATRAEHNAGSTLRENVDDAPYRSDLASVVRPRRPQIATPAERSARPEESRPAPLKLVAEQRIDTPRAPIRPRRISAAELEVDIAAQAKEGSFSAFAEEVGANSLPDLLEAAAAYMSDVEGRPQFSRPMLMGKLKEVEQERFSREDSLRSFGQLLRQGKLQKLAGGRFAVTEETEFRATGRRHAG